MATQDLTFSVAALDKASRTFLKVAERVERLEKKLDQLDRTRAEPEVDVDVDENNMSRAAARAGRRAGRAFSEGAEDVGRDRKRFFFAALFKPDRGVVHALRTGVPAALGSPIGLAAITLGGLFAASFVGAVVSSGIFALIGAGFTGLAAAILKDNARLERSFASLAEVAGNQLERAASGLVPVFEQALGTVQTMFGSFIADPLQRIFEGLEPIVVPAVESAVRTISGVLDTLGSPEVLSGLQTVFQSISQNLPRFGAAFSEVFRQLAADADDIAEAFGGVTTVITGLIGFAGDLTTALTGIFNRLRRIGNIAGPALSGTFDFLGEADRQLREFGGQEAGEEPPAVHLLEAIGEGLERGRNLSEQLAIAWIELGASAENTGGKMAVMRGRAADLATASEELAEKQERLRGQVDVTGDALSAERDRLKQLEDGMFSAGEGILGLRESHRSYEEQLDLTRETLERNGETLDINTEKGRENAGAVDGMAAAALGHIQMMQQQGKSTEKIIEFTKQAREDFIAAAEAAGLESKEAENLADKLGLVPSEVKTKLEAIDNATEKIDELEERLDQLERELRQAKIRASVTGVDFATALLDEIAEDRTANIFVNTVGAGVGGGRNLITHSGGLITPGGIERFHTGGQVMRRAMRPDERMILAQTGERVLSRQQTRAFDDFMTSVRRGGVAGSDGAALDPGAIGRAVARAIDGATIIIDDRGNGRLVARRADLVGRAG